MHKIKQHIFLFIVLCIYSSLLQATFDYSRGFRMLSYTLPACVWGILSVSHIKKACNLNSQIAQKDFEENQSQFLLSNSKKDSLCEKKNNHILAASFYGVVCVLAGIGCYFNCQAINKQ